MLSKLDMLKYFRVSSYVYLYVIIAGPSKNS